MVDTVNENGTFVGTPLGKWPVGRVWIRWEVTGNGSG
jgi:hypothetical protein